MASIYKQLVQDFYEQHNPKKVAEVPEILQRWKGKEGVLLAALHQKYEVRTKCSAKPMNSLCRQVPYTPTPQEQKQVEVLVAQDEEEQKAVVQDRQLRQQLVAPPLFYHPKSYAAIFEVDFYLEYNPELSNDDDHLDKVVRNYRGREDALFAALEYKYDVARLQQWTRCEQFSRALRMGADMGIIQR